jgi:hypothetical protein
MQPRRGPGRPRGLATPEQLRVPLPAGKKAEIAAAAKAAGIPVVQFIRVAIDEHLARAKRKAKCPAVPPRST